VPVDRRGAATFDPAALLSAGVPFEPGARLAIAVSGGADSMALALLASRWARDRDAGVTALIVDHGLRPGSAAEARRVAGWLDHHGIDRQVLTWRGEKPATGIQAAAREARYRLMTEWCRRRGVMHLWVGHHREDQAETFLLRLDRGSRLDGLAAMAGVAETPWLRITRPLLTRAPAELRAFLIAENQEWIEDPSNRDEAFARVRVRRALAALDDGRHGDDRLGRRLAATASGLGHARAALERETAGLLARTAAIFPTGYAVVDMAAIVAAPPDIGLRALSRLVTAIGGRVHAPRRERLERLHARLREGGIGRGATLGGCLLWAGRDGVVVAREPLAIRDRIEMNAPGETVWDGRFRISVRFSGSGKRRPLIVAALGREGWSWLSAKRPELRDGAVPGRVRHALPALWSGRRPVCVPHLGFVAPTKPGKARIRCQALFWPHRAIATTEFSVV
jgi:tRNA(Ile)-lysidine synthase